MSANIVKIFNSIIVYCANNCSPLNPETNIHNLQKKEVNTRGSYVELIDRKYNKQYTIRKNFT